MKRNKGVWWFAPYGLMVVGATVVIVGFTIPRYRNAPEAPHACEYSRVLVNRPVGVSCDAALTACVVCSGDVCHRFDPRSCEALP
jgi:hypothetical protein